MTDHDELARKFNNASNLDQAATHFALAAFELMVTKKFEDTKTLSLGAAELLRAISCDVRVNNTGRATHLFDFAKVLCERVRADTDDEILEGLSYEWVGDGYLMLGDQRAIECYEVAAEKLADVPPGHGWGGE
ncbi:hypothetical protein [Haladaptatus sp. QDMS2]|nr:hypothetical protein [Haladaptatus sp. QDMS2]